MVYGPNFTQCICTGYCESLITLPSSIIDQRYYYYHDVIIILESIADVGHPNFA